VHEALDPPGAIRGVGLLDRRRIRRRRQRLRPSLRLDQLELALVAELLLLRRPAAQRAEAAPDRPAEDEQEPPVAAEEVEQRIHEAQPMPMGPRREDGAGP